jgi:hypothetical protein
MPGYKEFLLLGGIKVQGFGASLLKDVSFLNISETFNEGFELEKEHWKFEEGL